MTAPNRSIFRQRAIAKYVQRQERQVMLRLVSPPIFGFLWLLLLILIGGGILVWSLQVPLVVQARGIVVQQTGKQGKGQQTTAVLLLLPANQQASLKAGQSVRIMIAPKDITFTGVIDHVEAGAMSPATINAQFHIQIPQPEAASGPYIVATVPVAPAAQIQLHPGSVCQAQVQTSSANVFSLLPGFNNFQKLFNDIFQTSPSA
ncbi:MAG TPA: hypothetical protein VFB60_09205 [Ktedonobacteraceae bacterium]|nr:hypothetical protein [Ktedonobacteraceae bacterium]